PNSQLEFYCYASGIYLVFGAWQLYAIEGESSTLLLDQFDWAQDNGYEGPSWVKYNIDLDAYAGKTVRFSFVYVGDYGEDEAIDGFKIKQADMSEDASITIFEGEQVHFHDLSTGNVVSRNWTFDGGDPNSSTEKDPVVTYNTAGEYAVKLEVADNEGAAPSTMIRNAFVKVLAQAPIARIGMPANAYLSPFVAAFVPTGVEVQFQDESTGFPTQWEWQFPGASPATSNDQNPVVIYDNAGTYSVMLTASNEKGSSQDAMINAVQAGGEQYIWNIAPEENSNLGMMEMGWYGNYAGTNWLGMAEFAEHYDAPLAEATIESVAVYFGKTTAVTTDADITLSLRSSTRDAMPGEIMASTTLKASELAYDADNVVETLFTFDYPVPVENEFFVSIGGFPNNNGDDIAILLLRRGEGEKCTAYQFVLDEDENYNYLETGKWYKNTDDPISLAIAPILNYDKEFTGIADITIKSNELISIDDGVVKAMQGVSNVAIYDINGRCIATMNDGSTLSMSNIGHGIYIVRAVKDGKPCAIKIVR
ncbi:MAG: PKD domain-containing protein, partial [Muribaculaceae bacterium]|nr:PKD domain-containing protein [Muribaculaceae bacterium]